MRLPCLNAERSAQVESREHRPKPVMTHVRKRSAPEIVPAAKYRMRVMRMIRAVVFGPTPKIPVEPFRHGRPVRGDLRTRRPHGPGRPVVHFPELAYNATVDSSHDQPHGVSAAIRQEMRDDFGLASRFDHAPGLVQSIG